MAKSKKPRPRSSAYKIVERHLALSEIFRKSAGNEVFTIKTLTDAAMAEYPRLFLRKPDESTITTMVATLMRTDFPIEQVSKDEAARVIKGSLRQLAWRYNAGNATKTGFDRLTGREELLSSLVGIAVSVEALLPLEGMALHDDLASLQKVLLGDARAKQLARQIQRKSSRYAIGSPHGKRKDLSASVRRRLLRVIEDCCDNHWRLEIGHKHRWDQKEEKTYVLEPHQFRQRGNSVYLIAHQVTPLKNEVQQYKLDRITRAKKLPTPNCLDYGTDGVLTGRIRPPGDVDWPPLQLDKLFDSTIHAYMPRPGEQPVSDIRIEVDGEVAYWVKEEMLNPRQKCTKVRLGNGKDGMLVEIPKAYVKDIVPRILSLGEFVSVKGPPDLVKAVRERLKRASSYYEENPTLLSEEGGKPTAPRSQ